MDQYYNIFPVLDRYYDDCWGSHMDIIMKEIEKGENEMNKTEPKKFWMITGDGNAPKVRHYNRQDAVNEATRLAKNYPGIEFFVMESVEMLTQPSGVVRHRF